MSRLQVEQIAAGTQSKGKYGPWKDHFIEMGRKTVIRRLAKYLPLSIEFQTAAALDSMADAGRDQNIETNTIDGEFTIVPDEANYLHGGEVDGTTGEIQGRMGADAPVDVPAQAYSHAEQDVQRTDPQTTYAKVLDGMIKAKTLDALDTAAVLIGNVADEGQRIELNQKYDALREDLEAKAPA